MCTVLFGLFSFQWSASWERQVPYVNKIADAQSTAALLPCSRQSIIYNGWLISTLGSRHPGVRVLKLMHAVSNPPGTVTGADGSTGLSCQRGSSSGGSPRLSLRGPGQR